MASWKTIKTAIDDLLKTDPKEIPLDDRASKKTVILDQLTELFEQVLPGPVLPPSMGVSENFKPVEPEQDEFDEELTATQLGGQPVNPIIHSTPVEPKPTEDGDPAITALTTALDKLAQRVKKLETTPEPETVPKPDPKAQFWTWQQDKTPAGRATAKVSNFTILAGTLEDILF